MKKKFLLGSALLTAGAMMALVPTAATYFQRQAVNAGVTEAQRTVVAEAPVAADLTARQAVDVNLTEVANLQTTTRQAPKGAPIANIIGKSYVTFFGSFTNYGAGGCADYMTVEQGTGDTVVLKHFAQGYDVKGVWNKTTGAVTCPAGQIVGDANGTALTFNSLNAAEGKFSRTTPVTVTFTEEGITFSSGVYVCPAASAGGYGMMSDITCVEANGKISFTQYNNSTLIDTFDYPIYYTQPSDSKVEIQGMQSWLFGHNYKVPFTIEGSTATLSTTDSIDYYEASSSDIRKIFALGYNGSSLTSNPTFAITKSGNNTVMTAESDLFIGWNTGGTDWRGYFPLKNWTITLFGEDNGGGGEEPGDDEINIIGKSYVTFFDSFTNYGNAADYFTVEQGTGDTVVLKHLAQGYDVKGVWDKTAGTVSCPHSQVVGNHSSLGAISFYPLIGTSYYKDRDVVITFKADNTVTFSTGIYCAVTAGGLSMMRDITCVPANGKLTFDQYSQTTFVESHEIPIYYSNLTDSKVEIQGLQAWLYGHNYKVPFTIEGSTAILSSTDSIDWYYTSSAGTQCFFALINGSNGLQSNPTFTITKNGKNTVMSANEDLFIGYNTGDTNWSGFFPLKNYKVELFGEDNGSGEDPTALVGKKFLARFQKRLGSGYMDANLGFFVKATENNDSIIFTNLALGFDVKGTYDESTGMISIPTGVVVGQNATYGPVTLNRLYDDGAHYDQQPITAYYNGDSIVFNDGIYTTMTSNGTTYYSAFFKDIKAVPANAVWTANRYTNSACTTLGASFEYPVIAKTENDSTFTIEGMSSWNYCADKIVPFKMNKTANQAILTNATIIDYYQSGGVDMNFSLIQLNSSNRLDLSVQPTFNITTTDGKSTIANNTDHYFWGYPTDDEGNFRGYYFAQFQIVTDFDIYEGEQGGGNQQDETEVTVDGINYTLDLQKLEATVTGCDAALTALNVPETFQANGNKVYTVVRVARAAFQANTKITSMSLPKSLKAVETDAFRNMSNLRELKIADLAAWCNVLFANGNANPIYNVFPTREANWGKVYFNGQQASTSIEVPAGVTRLERTFYGFKSLTSVNLPSTLKTLGNQVFANNINLITCAIPEGVDSLGSVFFGCEKINNIDIPRTVKKLPSSLFYGCKALTDVKLHTGLEEIGPMPFSGCTNLKKLDVPSTVTTINMIAFSGVSLTELTMRNMVPPTIQDMTVEDFAATCTLKVYEDAIAAYKAATGWKLFMAIEKINGSVDGLDLNEAPAVYYNLNGYKVNATNLAPGIYIKVQNGKSTRVLVK